MVKNCPQCKLLFADPRLLYEHMLTVHGFTTMQAQIGSGWYEYHNEEEKAPDHVAAATRAQIQKQNILTQPMKKADPVSIPIFPVEKKKSLQLPDGWAKAGDSYVFEQTLSEEHTAEDIILIKAVGKVTVGYGLLELYTYTKSTSELAELVERENILTNKLKDTARTPMRLAEEPEPAVRKAPFRIRGLFSKKPEEETATEEEADPIPEDGETDDK